MTPEERDRLVRIEEATKSIGRRLENVERDVKDFRALTAKAGGAMIALTAIGAAVGSALTFFKEKLFGIGS